MFAFMLVAITCSLNLLLGAFVLLRNSKVAYSKYFFLMTLFTAAWAACNGLTNITTFDSLVFNDVFNRGAYACAAMAILAGTLFTYRFPVNRDLTSYEKIFLTGSSVVLICLSLTHAGAGTIGRDGDELAFFAGDFIAIYVGILVGYMLLIARNLWAALRTQQGGIKEQAWLILFGFSFAVVSGIISNIVLPIVLDNSWSTQLGPFFTIALVGCITYAIVRHRLFDIRTAVARSVGYVLSIAVFAALYGFIVFGIAHTFFDLQLSVVSQIFLSAATGLASLLFPYLLSRFNALTSRLFYRDAYDPQQLYGDLNKVLVSSLDIKLLMTQSIGIIEKALKAEYALIGLRDGPQSQRIFASRPQEFKQEDVNKLRKLTPSIHSKVILTDFLDAPRQRDTRELLRKYDIAALVRLTQNTRNKDEGFGYLALGSKKSGNPYTPQDVEVLDTVANELIIAIQNALHYEEIQRFNIQLQARVDEATRKLRRTNEKLRELDEAKDDFVSMASHQLRTPLTSIKGYTSMVLEGDAGKINATQRKLLEQSFFSSQRMVYLIADLLNVSRLKTGKFIIEPVPVNLAEVVEQEIGQLKEVASGRSLTLTYERPDSFPTLMLDETKTRQVIMNFVDNAIYYTPAGGNIKVQLIETPASVELRVSDDGIGVPKSEQPHLFTKFYRANNARKARPDGTGLGLFMAKKVIVAEGGAIIFETEEGKGSTFGFIFSKSKAVTPDTKA